MADEPDEVPEPEPDPGAEGYESQHPAVIEERQRAAEEEKGE